MPLKLNANMQNRMEEILELVKFETESILLKKPLGAILTGGCSFLNGTRDLGQNI